MQTVESVLDLRETLKRWRLEGLRIAFVPTMGNLHAGHLRLVNAAKAAANRVVVSIFVNPTQFGPGEDFESYPRTVLEDSVKLEQAGADLLFLPSVSEMYGNAPKTVVSVKELSERHCGLSRPGHFNGVATVVCKLFNMVQPDSAFFGRKDFQQIVIIRTMVRDLNIPVEIESVETVRETSGLAMSSRNGYLNPKELGIASQLYRNLCIARDEVLADQMAYKTVEQEAIDRLQQAGFLVDYFSICRTSDLLPATPEDEDVVILAAAKLGKTRLIDNITFTRI